MALKTVIEVNNVSVTYRALNKRYGKLALKNVTLPVYEGKITCLMGESGCGKTTLLRVLNGMSMLLSGVEVTVEGEILYRGKNIYGGGVSFEELRRKVTYVQQSPYPFPSSVWENVAYGPYIWGIHDSKELDKIVERSLKKADLWDRIKSIKEARNTGANALSGGQKQRLEIACALAIEPKVMLMDESTASLDPKTTGHIQTLIKKLVADEGLTVVIVTHDLTYAYNMADYVAYLEPTSEGDDDKEEGFSSYGMVEEFGTHDQIFNHPQSARTKKYVARRPKGD